MTKVSFDLTSDSSSFLDAFASANAAVIDLNNETKDLSELSKKTFKANADEVQKFSNELQDGSKATEKMRKEVESIGKTKNIVQQLKAQIKEYTAEAYKAGEGTLAFKTNLEKAGKLKDQLADLNGQVKALTGNIGENLAKAAGNSLGLIARGFEGISSASILLGNNTKEFEETLLKLQAFNGLANVAGEFAGIGDKIAEIKLGFAPVTELFRNGASSITSSYTSANESLRGFFKDFLGNSKAALKGGLEFIKGFGSNAVGVAKSAGAGFVSFFSNFGTNMKQFAASAKSGINTIGNAIRANPLGIILTVITLVIAAFVAMKEKVKPIAILFEYLGKLWDTALNLLERIGQALGFVATESEKRSQKTIENTKAEVDAIKSRYDYEIQLLEAAGKATIGKEREKSDAVKKRAKDTIFELEKIKRIEGQLTKEQTDAYKEAQDIYVEAVKERTIKEVKYAKEVADKEKAEQEKRKEQAKQLAEKRKQQEQDLLNSLNELAKRAQQAELEGLTGKERLDKQKEKAEQELELLRQVIIKKGQLLDKNFKLSREQEQLFNLLEERIFEEHAAGLIKIESDKANMLADIQAKETTDAIKALELRAKIQEEKVNAIPKPDNLTKDQEVVFELQKEKAILEIRKKFIQESEQLKIKEINDRANQELTALQGEKAAIQFNNDEISKLRVQAIDKDIAAIKQNAELSKEALVTETDVTVKAINNRLGKIGEEIQPKKLDINKLLGLDSGEIVKALKQFGEKNQIDIKVSPESIDSSKAAVQQLVSSLKDLMQQYFEIQNELLDNELKANQERLDARDQNLQDLRSKLQEEEALRDQGLANNSDRIKEEIAQQEAAKQADIQRQREIQAEKKKLAKQQLIIDTAMQASQLVLAIAQLFAQGSSFWVGPVPVGLIVAGIAATAMTASFIAGKKRAFDAVNSGAAQLYTGGYTGDGGKYEEANAVVHKGEYVMNQDKTNEHWDLLHGIHTDDKSLMERGIRDLIAGKGIYLASDIPEEINSTKNAIRTAQYNMMKVDNSGMEKRLEAIENHVNEIRKNGKDNETVMPDGTRIIKKGDFTTTIRPKS